MSKFIIVLGMAHSGTTIFTKILSQCPEIKLITNGSERAMLENDYLLHRDPLVKNLVNQYPADRYLLLKRPWMEQFYEFFLEHLPDAHYYILLKTFEAQVRSWSRPNSYIEHELRISKEIQRKRYDTCLGFAINFPLPKKIINYEELCAHPNVIFEEVQKSLDIQNFKFNTSEITRYMNAKRKVAIKRRR